ncbi:MAG: LssY C-terminal domain-containing protein [Planctomycetes bacterium]|nr:LssY C-terminal domain-containing protein [Planctomycetota bacterium]
MSSEPTQSSPESAPATQRPHHVRRVAKCVFLLLLTYLLLAYLLIPMFWLAHTHGHPSLEGMPRITTTADGIPGDPLNVALIGSESEVKSILESAGWFRADPLGLRSDLRIAEDSVLGRPYDDAPVSRLYLFNRREDLAYEKPLGDSPRHRHHVRWWRSPEPATDGRPFWIGSATFDRDIGLSHTTGQVTHHIAPDVDAERDGLFIDLDGTGRLDDEYFVDDFQKPPSGRNGGGDPWHTDGRLRVGAIRSND